MPRKRNVETEPSEPNYPELTLAEQRETAEWLAQMIREGMLRPSKTAAYSPLTLKDRS